MKNSTFKPRTKPMSRGTSTLKRSGFSKPSSPMARSSLKPASKPMKSVGERGKRMRQGKIAPNAEEQRWLDAAQAFGCIVCHLHYQAKSPAEIHHLKEGDRRIGHLASIGLCTPHHRGGDGDGQFISRHPWKKRFESAYGTETELLDQLRNLIPTR